MGQFRKTILAAAHDADLTFGERVKLRVVMRLRPRALEQAILDEAIVEGVVPEGLTLSNIDSPSAPMAIDWDALANFIVKILPAIMQIIQLFMVPNPGAMIAFVLCAALASTAIAQCPNCPQSRAPAIHVLPAPAVQVRVQAQPATMSHSQMVALHNRLHGGGSWTWPGDLAEHLRREHGVATGSRSATETAWQASVSFSRSGTRPRWRLFGRWR